MADHDYEPTEATRRLDKHTHAAQGVVLGGQAFTLYPLKEDVEKDLTDQIPTFPYLISTVRELLRSAYLAGYQARGRA